MQREDKCIRQTANKSRTTDIIPRRKTNESMRFARWKLIEQTNHYYYENKNYASYNIIVICTNLIQY